MIINDKKIYPVAEQTGLSFNLNFTPKDFSPILFSLKEGNDFNFNLISGKISDPNNRNLYFYNTGENINISGNIGYNNYDYHINGNVIALTGYKNNFKVSGLTISGSNVDLTDFKILGDVPKYDIYLDDSFIFGKAISGWVKNLNSNSLNFRILSGSISSPQNFSFGPIPNTIISSGGISINPNLSSPYSITPIGYQVNINLLTDFGFVTRSFPTSGIPGTLLEFFISLSPSFFNFNPTLTNQTYIINSFFTSGGIEYDKYVKVDFNYESGQTGLFQESTSLFGSGYNNLTIDQIFTGSGIYKITGTSTLSGYYDNQLIVGIANGTGNITTGIYSGDYRKNILLTGSGIYNAQHFELDTYIISGYRENVLGSGFVSYSGNLTGYVSQLTGSGTYNFYSGFSSILKSNEPIGILRKNEFFTGILDYRLSQTGRVRITGFNTTYLDYSGYSDGNLLTGLLEGSGYIYSALADFNTTGILRSEVNNRRITGIQNLQIVDFVLNTGINLAKIVSIVSGIATGNYINDPNIFGISILGTGTNIITGSNAIYGSGYVTGSNTGYIIKDSYVATGNVSGIIFYTATGDSNNPTNPSNYVKDLYSVNITGNTSGIFHNFPNEITFTGDSSTILFTGLIVQQGTLYSTNQNLTGINTIVYTSLSGFNIKKTGLFIAVSTGILERNVFFTGNSNYASLVYSTGTASGLNDTYYNWGEVAAASNKTFTGIIANGSGSLITTPITFGAPVSTTGLLSGQIGTGVNSITISQLVLNPFTSQINDVFFTGIKTELRSIVVSGIATGTKYNNYVGLQISGSGYLITYGSGYITGSGYVNTTGFGSITGTDGTVVSSASTGSVFVELSGNPNNISDIINTFSTYQNLLSTGTGFFILYDKSLTGTTASAYLLSGVGYLVGSGLIPLIRNENLYGTGSNISNANPLIYENYSGLINNPLINKIIFYTGISNQFINASPFYTVATGLNTTTGTNINVVLTTGITLSGYITGGGVISKILTTGFSGELPASINPNTLIYFTGTQFAFSQNQYATGYFTVTGRFNNFTGNYSGLIYATGGYIPYFDIITNIPNSKNLLAINSGNNLYYNLSVISERVARGYPYYDEIDVASISGSNVLNISGKENIFIYGGFTGVYIGNTTGTIIFNNKYYILPYQAGGSGNLTGLFETLTGIIQFTNDSSSVNDIVFANNNIIFGGSFTEYVDIKDSNTTYNTRGLKAVNLTGGFISNWYVDQNNDDNNSFIKDIVFVNKDKILLGGNFSSLLTESRKGFAMVDFRGDGAFPDDNTYLSGLNLYLEGYQSPNYPYPILDATINSIIYNTGESNKYYVLGNFVNALSTGERLKTKTVSANNNFYARPKTSKKINSLLLKADMTGLADQEDIYYKDYIGVDNYGYKVLDFETPASEDGPKNNEIYGYKEIENNYYVYGEFNNVGSRFRKGFGSFDTTSGFIKNANVNIEGNTRAIESSGDYVFVGGDIRSYGGIPYGFGADDIDHVTAGYAIKNQLTIDRSFVPIQPWGGGYVIYDIKSYNNKIYTVGYFDYIRMPTGNGSDTSSMNRRSSFAVFDLSGNLLPESLHFTQYDGNYEGAGGYSVRTLFISGSTGYFGGDFESVVGDGPQSNLPIATSIRYSGFRTAAFNLDTLHPITGYTGHFDGTVFQIDHFTGGYIIAVGTFDNYYRPYNVSSRPLYGSCVLNAVNGTGIFQSGACPTISGNYFNNTNYNDLRGYYRRSDGHYYLYGRLIRGKNDVGTDVNDNLGLMLFNGTGGNTSVNEFGAAIRPNEAITGFKFLLNRDGVYYADNYINSVIENGNDLLVGGDFNTVSGRNSPYVNATGLIVINKNSGMLVNTGINIGLLRNNGLDGNWDEVFDIKKYSNKIYVGGRFRHFKFDAEANSSGIAAGKFAVFDTGYNIERSLGCNTYDGDSYIYKIYSGNDRSYLVGRHFGNGDQNYYNSYYSFSVQSPKYWDYIGNNNANVGRIGLIQLNRSGYELPLTPINLSGIYLNNANETINVITKHNSGLFLGGTFTSINNFARTGIAWIDYNGVIKDWAPNIEPNFGESVNVKDIEVSGDSVIFVGNFAQVNNQNRAACAQIKITGIGVTSNELTDLNLNSNLGFTNYNVNVIYNDTGTTGYYFGGQFSEGIIKVNKNTLNQESIDFGISNVYKDGILSLNKINNIFLVGGNFVGFSGKSGAKDFVGFVLSGNRVSGVIDSPQLSISGVSDIEVNNNDIYVISSGSSRSYKFTLNPSTNKFDINSSWTPYPSKYSSNGSDYNLGYLMPSYVTKALVTGNDVYLVGDFQNLSYARNNLFVMNKSGELRTGITAEFLSTTDQRIDIDTSTRITALGYNSTTGVLIVGGDFVKINDKTNLSGIAGIKLSNNEIIDIGLNINIDSYISNISTLSGSQNIIVGNFVEDIAQRITGGDVYLTGNFEVGNISLTGLSVLSTGNLILYNYNEGVYDDILTFSGTLPYNITYTGITGYISNATGSIAIGPSPVVGNFINIKIQTGLQYQIDGSVFINPNGDDYYYGTFSESASQFSNLNELYYLLTGGLTREYMDHVLDIPNNKINLYPKISGTFGNSGNFNVTQNANSFYIQNFTGGKNYTYLANLSLDGDRIGFADNNILFTGTGFYTKFIDSGTYQTDDIVLTTTGLWLASGYFHYNSGMLFQQSDFGKRTYFEDVIIDPQTNSSLSGIPLYSEYSTKNILKLYPSNRMTGFLNEVFTGSGSITGYTTDYGTGSFVKTSGNLIYTCFKTGYNQYQITGSYINYNNYVKITGRFDVNSINAIYTGSEPVLDIASVSYVSRVVRTGLVDLSSSQLLNSVIESSKTYIATGYVNINTGILFLSSDQGKKTLSSNLITGSGSVIFPPNVFPQSPNFTGRYDFVSTGTGYMTFTGEYKYRGTSRVTGSNLFATSGYTLITGAETFLSSDEGVKYLVVNYTGASVTGTLLPINTLDSTKWNVKSGYDHIVFNENITILGSGAMTGYLTDGFSFNKRYDISGKLEYLANFTGITSGLVTGFVGTGFISIPSATTNDYATYPYDINSYFPILKNITPYITIDQKNKTFAEIFDPTQFPYDGYLTMTVYGNIAPRYFFAADIFVQGYNIWTEDFATSANNYIMPNNSLVISDIYTNVGGGAEFFDYSQYNLAENISFAKRFVRTGIYNVTGSAITTGFYQSKTEFLITGLSTGYFPITGTGIVDLTGYITLDKSLTNFVNYPYPSGDSIAYLTLTGLNNFTGYFISGVKITGLYNKNFVGLFSGSNSGSYTGTWSGSGTFTGYQQITYSGLDSGKKSVNLNQSLINSGLESGLVPSYTLGLYSGLKTIQNINYNQTLTITGSGYMEKIISGFALAGTTSGSGVGLITGYFSGTINKNYSNAINYETGLFLTGFLSGNSNIVLSGYFTGTIALTGYIYRNINLFTSGELTGSYLATKSFTGAFDFATGASLTGSFIPIQPNSTGYSINTLVKSGDLLLFRINYNNNISSITGNLRCQVYTGNSTGSVINNTVYGASV